MSTKENNARRRILAAFWQLYAEIPFDQISVSAVTKRAGCNRATFYLYYKDLRHLLDEEEAELLTYHSWLLDVFSNSLPRLDKTDVIKLFAHQADAPQIDPRIAILGGPGGDPVFQQKIKDNMKCFLRPHLRDSGPYAEYTLEYICSGLLSILHLRLRQEQTAPAPAFIEHLVDPVSSNLTFVEKDQK